MTYIVNNENSRFCSSCKSVCCKILPGICSPDDFKGQEHIRNKILSEKYAIDWYEGETVIYFVRPATKDAVGVTFDPSWGGECVFLKEDGCVLKFEERPFTCRAMVPKEGGGCASFEDKFQSACRWKDYQDFLRDFR